MTTTIEFGASPFGPRLITTAAIGDRLMDTCDDVGAPIPFSCRSSSCGTCLVEVTKGAKQLSPIEPEERLVLSLLGRFDPADAQYRLACQVIVVANGSVHLRMA